MRANDREAVTSTKRIRDRLFVHRVQVGVQKAHRDRGRRWVKFRDRAVVRAQLRAARIESLGHSVPARPCHQRRHAIRERVVERGPDLARDLDLVGEALRCDERHCRSPPFQQGVGRDGRAVSEDLHRCVGVRRVDRPQYRMGGILGCRRDLGNPAVRGDDVGKGPTGIDAETHPAEPSGGAGSVLQHRFA